MLPRRPISISSVVRALIPIYLVRIYIGTALILPVLATSGIAAPPQTPYQPAENRTVLTAGNPRIDLLNQAIEQYPDNAAFYNSRGWYSFIDGDYTQTVSDYSQVIALGIETIDPVYHTSVYYVRGLAYAELGNTALALDSLLVAKEMYGAEGDTAAVQEVEAVIEQLSEQAQ